MRNILLISIIVVIFSCEKDNSVTMEHGNKPSKIIWKAEYNIDTIYYTQIDTSYYTYDGSNLNTIESQNQKMVFEYQSNRVIKGNVFRIGDDLPWRYQGYEYNNKGQLIKVTFNTNVNSNNWEWVGEKVDVYRLMAYYGYEYYDNNVIKEYYYDNQTKDTVHYNMIKLDDNNNIILSSQYQFYADRYMKHKESSYEYDNENHYFKNVNYPAYASMFSTVNNIIKAIEVYYVLDWDNEFRGYIKDSITNIVNYQIEYNDLGYPIIHNKDDYSMKIEYN